LFKKSHYNAIGSVNSAAYLAALSANTNTHI